MSFHRIVEDASLYQAKAVLSPEQWKDRVTPTQYKDYIIDLDKFVDSPSIVYACRMEADGTFTVLKDNGITAKMAHTFAGWPISAPLGKVFDLDPLSPKPVVEPILEPPILDPEVKPVG